MTNDDATETDRRDAPDDRQADSGGGAGRRTDRRTGVPTRRRFLALGGAAGAVALSRGVVPSRRTVRTETEKTGPPVMTAPTGRGPATVTMATATTRRPLP